MLVAVEHEVTEVDVAVGPARAFPIEDAADGQRITVDQNVVDAKIAVLDDAFSVRDDVLRILESRDDAIHRSVKGSTIDHMGRRSWIQARDSGHSGRRGS